MGKPFIEKRIFVKRIILMVIRNLLHIPKWMTKLIIYGKSKKYSEQMKYSLLKEIILHANKSGNVTIESYGLENIPKENGFIIFPNHQGLFDVLIFLESCPNPFSVVMKKEVANIPFLKQVFAVMDAKSIDREDIRQSMKVIMQMTKEVKEGRNYIIFAEGTRSKDNSLLDFKGGSFKSAINAKCPIVPVAIIDSYKAFDTNSIKPLTVQIHYLEPLYYEDYKEMKSLKIAEYVKNEIQKTIKEYEK
jgi:1-acyl-sn-glycerol-3-phosphate acyltransferase